MIKKLEIWCEKVTGLHMKARSTMKKVYLEFWSPQSISCFVCHVMSKHFSFIWFRLSSVVRESELYCNAKKGRTGDMQGNPVNKIVLSCNCYRISPVTRKTATLAGSPYITGFPFMRCIVQEQKRKSLF